MYSGKISRLLNIVPKQLESKGVKGRIASYRFNILVVALVNMCVGVKFLRRIVYVLLFIVFVKFQRRKFAVLVDRVHLLQNIINF